jgi:class 3 adenylate cyclase
MEQEIRFCTTFDGVRIAYATVGEGPPLVFVPGWISHLEVDWQFPQTRRLWEAYAEHFTFVRLDKRGTGLSDRNVGDYSLDARVRDLEAVVDHLRLKRFALFGISEGGPTSIEYVVRHPRRVTRMLLYGTFARGNGLSGSADLREAVRSVVRAEWGLGSTLMSDLFLGQDASPASTQFFSAYQRMGANPEDALAMLDADVAIDISDVLHRVGVPTLIVHARDDRIVPIELGREIAAGIPNARFMSVPGPHVSFEEGRDEQALEAELSFLLEGVKAKEVAEERVKRTAGGLVTILFTDMQGSTSLTQRLGDAKAQEVLRTHNTVIRDALKAHNGSETKHTGDGIMASFASASKALEASISMQRAFAEHNDSNPDTPIRVRIGLNAGEPVAEDADLFGTAVQLAARICAQAEPGQILAGNVVRELAAGKKFLFSDCGGVALRGFEDPVRLFELSWRA